MVVWKWEKDKDVWKPYADDAQAKLEAAPRDAEVDIDGIHVVHMASLTQFRHDGDRLRGRAVKRVVVASGTSGDGEYVPPPEGKTVRSLSELLQMGAGARRAVTVLDLGKQWWNSPGKLGPEGIQHLAPALQHVPHLTTLHLR